jgi:hypothetical protein
MHPPLSLDLVRNRSSEVVVVVISIKVVDMPAHRGESSSTGGGEGSQPGYKNPRRSVQHVTRACVECRKRSVIPSSSARLIRRKTKCDGSKPQCTPCMDKGSQCEYSDEDKRK